MVASARMNGARSYRVTELLGRGAFGAVYLADTVGTGISRPVAIKVLRPEQSAIPGQLERLRDEARMLSMIRHRAIVRVDDLVELDGHWSVVMEYIEGCDVGALLTDGPFPPRVALAIAEEIANALHVAATQPGPDGRPIRLVHRDVKPGNIRVTAQGEVKLLDFGVARADFSAREAGGTNAVFGTPTYMAPERFRGEDTFAGDVYALGVTLFEMLAGEPPGQSPMELERVPPGIKLAGAWRQIRDTSLPLRDLVCAMLAHSPGERPSAKDCARSFSRIRGQLGGMILEDWAERVVPPAMRAKKQADSGGRVGTVMIERPSEMSLRVQGRSSGAPRTAMLAAAGTLAFGTFGVFALAIGGLGGWWIWSESTRAEAPVLEPPVVELVAAPPPQATAEIPPVEPVTAELPPVEVPAVEPPPAETVAVATVSVETPPTAATRTETTRVPAAEAPPAAMVKAPVAAPRKEPGPPASSPRGMMRTGIVALDGQASAIILTGTPGVFGAGEVAVGDYTADVTLTDGETVQVRGVTVNPGSVTKVSCDAETCREIEEW
ncbi:MAG: protein kinase [Pseudomonadota bacterium]|nr:protein kinase [Pseudomonadota bacterium]